MGILSVGKPMDQQLRIVTHIRQHGAISRSALSRELGLAAPTVSACVRELTDLGIVTEGETEESRGGRPAIRIQLNPSYSFAIGIHVAMRGIRGALVDLAGRVVTEHRPAESNVTGADETIEAICRIIDILKAQTDPSSLRGVGIGISGVIREGGHVLRTFPYGPPWSSVPLADRVESDCGVRPILMNDVQAAALGELRMGGWGEVRDFVLLHMGDGIAAGIVLNGSVYIGATSNAGEIGHNVVREDGPLCYCGNRGCLESLAAAPAVVRACRDAVVNGVQSLVPAEAGEPEEIEFAHIVSAAAKGDRLAHNLLTDAGRHIGEVAANLINVFDPQMLLLAGLLAEPGTELVESMRRTVRSRVLPMLRDAACIEFSRLRESASMLGASALVFDDLFSHPERLLARRGERKT